MSPSANRHTGYSRRAQYGTFFGYLAGVAGALIGAAALALSIFDPHAFASLRGVAAVASEPGGAASAQARQASHGFFATVTGYVLAGSRNARLQRELDAAKVRLIEAEATAEENGRLKALLGLAQQDPHPVAVTQIVSATGSSTRRFATIGAGASQGVAVGMPVRSPLGLVGRVLEVGPTASRVLLITDTESVVPARRAGDGIPAFAQGRSDGRLQLRLISLGINPLKPGDVFVTSGSGGLYRPGTPIAVVEALTRDGAIARLLSDPAATEFVTVERVWSPGALAPADPGTPVSPAL